MSSQCCAFGTCDRCTSAAAEIEENRRWQANLADISVEQLAIARAIMLRVMRTNGAHRIVMVPAAEGAPLEWPFPARAIELAAAFERYVRANLDARRARDLGPKPKRMRFIARWHWNRRRRALERADEVAIDAICRAGGS